MSVSSSPPGNPTAPMAVQVLSPAREAWRVFSRNKAAMLGLGLLVCIVLVMVLGPASISAWRS